MVRKACLLGLVALAWAGSAAAQDAEAWTPPGCAEVEAGSLEAELLDCDEAVPATPPVTLEVLPPPDAVEAPALPEVIEEDPEPEPPREVVEAPEPVVIETDVEPSPEPETVEPVVVVEEAAPESDAAIEDLPAEDWLEAHPVEEEATEPAEAEVEDAPEVREVEGEPETEVRGARGGGRDRGGEGLRIPKGHRPPPGSCRVWFPGRPPGHQPPPGSCDVEVPEGAVLIRG